MLERCLVILWLSVGRLSNLGCPATPEADGKRQGGLFNCCGRKLQPTTSPPEAQPSAGTLRCHLEIKQHISPAAHFMQRYVWPLQHNSVARTTHALNMHH